MSDLPKVIVVHEPERESFRVYLQIGERDGEKLFRYNDLNDGSPAVQWVEPGQEPPMFIRVDEYVAVALGEALAPRPVATERHLDDALQIRDWALKQIERMISPPVIT